MALIFAADSALNTAITAIFLILRLAGVGGKVFSQTVERQGCLSPSAWMESLSLHKTLPLTPCQIRKNKLGIPAKITLLLHRILLW